MCSESEKEAAAHVHRQRRAEERIRNGSDGKKRASVCTRESERLMAGVWQRWSENEQGQERRWVETDNSKKEQVGVRKDGLKEGKERCRRDNR